MSQQGQVAVKVSYNAVSNYIGQAYSMLITLASIPVCIHYLGTEAYGLIGFFVLLQNFTGILDFGLSATISRQIAQARALMNGFAVFAYLLKVIEWFFLLVSASIIAVIYQSSDLISKQWIKSVALSHSDIANSLELMGVIIALKLFSTFYRSGINGFEDQIWNNKATILINTLKYGGAIVLLVFISQNITIYFVYQLMIAIIEVVILRYRFYKNMPNQVLQQRSERINWQEISKIVPFALSIAYTSAAVIIIMQLDKLLLSNKINLEQLGTLNVIGSVTGLILVMATPIFLAYLPKITTLAAGNNNPQMTSVYTEMTQFIALMTACVTAMIACNAQGVLYAITGSKAAQAWGAETMVYYAIGTGFYVMGSVQYYLLNALGKLKLYVLGCTVSLIVLVPAIFFTVQAYSVLGASILWMLYGFSWFAYWGMLVHRKELPNFHAQWLAKAIAPIVISVGLSTWLISEVINISQYESRIVTVALGLLIGLVILMGNAFWLKSARNTWANYSSKNK